LGGKKIAVQVLLSQKTIASGPQFLLVEATVGKEVLNIYEEKVEDK